MSDQRATIYPALGYKGAREAMAWLTEACGFEAHQVYTDDGGKVVHAELALGGAVIMLGDKSDTPDPDNPWSTATMGVYVAVDDIDAQFAKALAAGAEVVRPLADTDYGAREFTIRDPSGFLWSFGTYRPQAG